MKPGISAKLAVQKARLSDIIGYPSGALTTKTNVASSFEGLQNQLLRPVDINPIADVAPLMFFQILIMRKEVRNLIS